MDVICSVRINCNIVELRAFVPFIRGLAFCQYYADVTIYCIDTGESMQFHCSPQRPEPRTWRDLRDQWVTKHGQL